MSKRVVFTEIIIENTCMLLCGLMEDGRLVDVRLTSRFPDISSPDHADSILGNIYVGKVKRVMTDLDAAFVDIMPGSPCYLSLKQVNSPVFVKSNSQDRIVENDEILVQVERDAVRGKAPTLSTNLNFSGRYTILTTENPRLGISSKLDPVAREHYKALFCGDLPSGCGLIIRTNARNVPDAEICSEIQRLSDKADRILSHADTHTCYSCLYRPLAPYLSYLQNTYIDGIGEIITDLPDLYDELTLFCENYSDLSGIPLTLYQDGTFPLISLLNLNREIKRAAAREVYLKSGGFLVIDQTEAMTVIDVNTGRSVSKKSRKEHFLAINREASREIARQLRLRNLSGIILVDYIDLDDKEDQRTLLEEMRLLVREDPIPVQVHDITALNLVEITRKKVEKSLSEQIKQLTMKNAL